MALLRVLLATAGLASLASAAPRSDNIESTGGPLFVPAAENKFHVDTANVQAAEHISYTEEEFHSWIANVNVTEFAAPSHTQPITAQEAGALAGRDVIGTDDRTLVTSTSYPWIAIGKVFASVPGGYIVCSGTLVGPRVVATARHCIVNNAAWYKFSPKYDNGDTLTTGMVTNIISMAVGPVDDACESKYDWALFVLDKPLGTQYGFFGAASFEADDATVGNQAFLFNAGYPGDRDGGNRMYQQSGKTGRLMYRTQWGNCANNGPISTDCDSAGGMSGGPLWRLVNDQRWQYGMMHGGYIVNGVFRDTTFSEGNEWVNAVAAARRDYP